MNSLKLLLAASVVMSVGCREGAADTYADRIMNAVTASREHAVKDSVDLHSYAVYSASRYGNGRTGKLNTNHIGEYEKEVIRKLVGRRYWEVCYGKISPEVAGATYCYYLEAENLNLLAIYRSK